MMIGDYYLGFIREVIHCYKSTLLIKMLIQRNHL